jgi:hypothetical protein
VPGYEASLREEQVVHVLAVAAGIPDDSRVALL